MSDYLIDFNRGSDSNNGISAPWQNLSKLASATLNSGDNVWLAADSTWAITSAVVLGTVSGTRASPVTIGRYYPSGVNTGIPIINYRRSIAANEWTYDGANNAWYFENSFDPLWGSYVLLGGEWGIRQESALPLGSVNKAWINSGTKYYVYAPSGADPTTYYGSVYLAPHTRGALTFSNDGTYVIVENIKAVNGGALVSVYSDTGTREFVLRNLQSYSTGMTVFLNTQTDGLLTVTVDGLQSDVGISGFIHAQDTSALGFNTLTVKNCNLTGGNLGYPQGAIYSQLRRPHFIIDNYIARMAYGTSLHQSDGCGIYTEVGSSGAVVRGNLVEYCHLAMQDNSGRAATFVGNVVRNCYAAMRLSDFSNVGSVDHTFDHNTIINGGTAIAAQGPNTVAGQGWYADDTSLAVKIRNNLFHGSSSQPAVELGPGTTGTVANNNWYGYASFILRYDGGASPITATGTLNLDPQIDSGSFLPANTSLHAAGTYLGGLDFYGLSFKSPPTIGAVQKQGTPNGVNASPTLKSSSVASKSETRTAIA